MKPDTDTPVSDLLGWTVVANVADHLRGGVEEDRFYQGTKQFSAGTKVHIGCPEHSVSYEHVLVTGLRRQSRRWSSCILHIGALTQFRVKPIYADGLFDRLSKCPQTVFAEKDAAEARLAEVLDRHARYAPGKLRPEQIEGPWGDTETSPYRPKLKRL